MTKKMDAILEHAAADPTLPGFSFTEVCQAFDALESASPARLEEAVSAFEAASAHWPQWSWSMRRAAGVKEKRVTPSGYRTWGGEIFRGERSKKHAILRSICMPAENWSKPFSLFNLKAASEDVPHLVELTFNKSRMSTKYLKTWREEGLSDRLRSLNVMVDLGASQAKELRRSRLGSLEHLMITSPQGTSLHELVKAKNLDSIVSLDIKRMLEALEPEEWEKASWMRGLRALHLDGYIEDARARALVAACDLGRLEELHLNFSGDSNWLDALSGLRAVSMMGAGVSANALHHVLGSNPELEHLTLHSIPAGGFDAIEEHPTKLKHLNLCAARPEPMKTQTWRSLLASGALTEVEELWVDQSFDVECAKMLEEWAPKLERLRWGFRGDEFFAYVQATPSLSALTAT